MTGDRRRKKNRRLVDCARLPRGLGESGEGSRGGSAFEAGRRLPRFSEVDWQPHGRLLQRWQQRPGRQESANDSGGDDVRNLASRGGAPRS